MNDVQKQLFQRVIQKLIARNQCTPSEIENMQKLLDNVRDTKNFHMIMEKLKECGQIELDSFEENFKEGARWLNNDDLTWAFDMVADGGWNLKFLEVFWVWIFESFLNNQSDA